MQLLSANAKFIASTSILMSLCGAGCQYLNPKFDGATSGSSASESSENPTTTSGYTSDAPTSTTTMAPTTGYETTSGTVDGDLPVDPSDSTVDSMTVTESTSTSGTESSTDPSETEGETENPLCAPNDPPQEFEIHVFDEQNNVVEEMCGEEKEYHSQVEWSGERIRLKTCDNACGNCDSTNRLVRVDYPNGVDTMKLLPAYLENGHCARIRITFDKPGEEDCVPSSIVITDIGTEPYRHYIGVSGSPENPDPNLLLVDIEPPEFECGDCDEQCCILAESGPHVIRFEDEQMLDATDYLAEGAVGNFMLDGRTAAAKNIMATGHELCDEIPQQLAWVVTTLPDL